MAAREARGPLAAQRAEERERLEDRLDVPAAAPAGRARHAQVLLDGELGEEPAPLGHERDARAHAPEGGLVRDVGSGEDDPAAARPVRPGDRAQQRRLPGTVRADDCERLAVGDVQRHLADRLQKAVPRVDLLDGEQAHATAPLPR